MFRMEQGQVSRSFVDSFIWQMGGVCLVRWMGGGLQESVPG